MPRKILGWCRKGKRALGGLDFTAGAAQHNMAKQFMRGSALSSYESVEMVLLTDRKANVVVHAEQQLAAHLPVGGGAHDPLVFQGLRDNVANATGCDIIKLLGELKPLVWRQPLTL